MHTCGHMWIHGHRPARQAPVPAHICIYMPAHECMHADAQLLAARPATLAAPRDAYMYCYTCMIHFLFILMGI